MTRAALAKRVDVAPNTVSNWTCDKVEPGLTNLRTLAEALGVTVDGLLGGGESFRDPSDAKRLVKRLSDLDLQPTVRAFSASAPDLMAILSEAHRQVEAADLDW